MKTHELEMKLAELLSLSLELYRKIDELRFEVLLHNENGDTQTHVRNPGQVPASGESN